MSECCDIDFEMPKKHAAGLVPINSGEQRCEPGHSWGAGVRLHYLVHYIISGRGTFYCGTNKFRMKKGQIFVVFPGTVVKYKADEKEPWHYAWVNFQGDEAKDILFAIGLSQANPVMNVNNGEELVMLLRKMPAERSTDISVNLDFSSKLYRFLSLIAGNDVAVSKGDNAYLEAAISYIKAHYYDKISVEQISAHIGISRKYLFTVFKNALDVSPKEYIIEYRIQRAKELLADDNLSIGNIAYSVGYNDQLMFSKMFRQKTGMSPTEFRKSGREHSLWQNECMPHERL